ncbi:serine/threonine-protein kinase [Citricoccus sp. NR2]|uniref:serine/threonine-protein kinase n=1 Tax=Citricoccus sp. NR2 TaxID=3004095 RepID=UPI0022DD759B|nr:serine/threonine-protein kinase [Citricoccus sp. NR2]WBL19697.1 serine/threonine-protein kinase [Citricoccus sp. NR2]
MSRTSRTSPPAGAQPGPQIPGYTWTQPLGRGGSAEVHRYRQHHPERDVAVKTLRPDAGGGAEAMLRREANVLAQVSSHPGVVSLFASGETAQGLPWLALEYCAGPLWHRDQPPLALSEALRTGVILAGALATVHAVGIVHRDVKPANVLRTAFGQPVLSDFGISGMAGMPVRYGDGGFSVPWAAPEVHRAAHDTRAEQRLSAAQDVYSAGATLWTWLVGRSPFERPGADNSSEALTERILRDPVPSTGRREVPRSLETLLAQAISADPLQRPSAADLGRRLQQIQRELDLPVTTLDLHADPADSPTASQAPLAEPDEDRTLTPADLARIAPPVVPDDDDDRTVVPSAAPDDSFGFSQHDSLQHSGPPRAHAAPESSAASTGTTGAPPRSRAGWWGIGLVIVAALVLGGALVTTMLRGGGWTQAPEVEEPEPSAQGPMVESVPGVSQLVLEASDGSIVATWTAPEQLPDITGATYGYQVQRSGLETIDQTTSQTTVRFPAAEGSNCIEVWVRGADGRTSPSVSECITP